MVDFCPTDLSSHFIYDQYGDNNMEPLGPCGIIPLKGSMGFTAKVNNHLKKRRMEYQCAKPGLDLDSNGFLRDDFRIKADTIRFSSGEGKAVIQETVRGHDIFIISDVMNHSCTYDFFGKTNHMSPDDHYQDLRRVILAISGKARRVNVIMPFLYESRQHKRNARESLDCAYMLKELHDLGIENIITFDAHDSRVANAIPIGGFENVKASYQIIKAIINNVPDLNISNDTLMVVSPDEGGISRAMYVASMLESELGTFYKRRDYTKIESGRNPIVAHEFLGDNVEDKDIIIVDDMISSGESMIDIARELKNRKAKRVFCTATFGLFTEGISLFKKAYEEGTITKVFSTNLIYRTPELLEQPWFFDVDLSKFVALIIDAINHDASLSVLMDPTAKIKSLISRTKEKQN
jgi:ribose-phosphate pyrophosphokinase